MLAAAAILFALHFVHLNADFPNTPPGSTGPSTPTKAGTATPPSARPLAATGTFPATSTPPSSSPSGPPSSYLAFKFTGVSAAAARATTLCVFALTLLTLYLLIQRHTRPRSSDSGQPLAASLTVLLLCASPLFFVFERMAILEPLLIALTVLALLAASYLHPKPLRTLPCAA